jgi:hypothetical protein
MTTAERTQRQNIRALFLIATVDEMERAKGNYNTFGQSVLQEMIDTCKAQGVDNFGKTV